MGILSTFQARRRARPFTAEKKALLLRGVLVLDVLLEGFNCHPTARSGEVARGPQVLLQTSYPQLLKISSKKTTGDTLQGVDDLRDAEHWRILHKKMYVVCLTIELQEPRRKAVTHGVEMVSHRLQMHRVEHPSPVLGYEDQVNVKIRYARAPTTKIT